MTTELENACQELGIEISSKHLGLAKIFDSEYKGDKWLCTLKYQGRTAEFEFQTGLGNRTLGRLTEKVGLKYRDKYSGDVYSLEEAVERGMIKPKAPSAGDLVYCLVSDEDACNSSFEDWCSDFGYGSDSIKAHRTYLACQENGFKLRKLLGEENIRLLREKEH